MNKWAIVLIVILLLFLGGVLSGCTAVSNKYYQTTIADKTHVGNSVWDTKYFIIDKGGEVIQVEDYTNWVDLQRNHTYIVRLGIINGGYPGSENAGIKEVITEM